MGDKSVGELRAGYLDDFAKCMKTLFPHGKGNIQEDFEEGYLYIDLFDHHLQNDCENLNYKIDKSSLAAIHLPLQAKPKKKRDALFTDTDSATNVFEISDTAEFNEEAQCQLIKFINVSMYLYRRICLMHPSRNREDKKTKKNYLNLFTIAASGLYDELYSQRGRNEFAYYFAKLLEHHDDIHTTVTPFKTDSRRSEFNTMLGLWKSNVEKIMQMDDNRPFTIPIANIVLAVGKHLEKQIASNPERYFVEASLIDMQSDYHNRLFIATFPSVNI